MNENEDLTKMNFVGFAHFYLQQCKQKSKANEKIQTKNYKIPGRTMADDIRFVNYLYSTQGKADYEKLRKCLSNLSDEFIEV